ncbi:hypothetical protein J6590_055311 [Homalodisca vitripennis]|nr:hypothetical protein J6590_055311 [Homalodisca vitripennis]
MHLRLEGKSLLADLDLRHLAKLPAHATGELQPGTPPTQLASSSDTLLATVECRPPSATGQQLLTPSHQSADRKLRICVFRDPTL